MSNFYLFYLSSKNLMDRLFLRSFFDHFPDWKKPTILLHDCFETSLEKTRFIAKRISAALSENLVVNITLSGETKNCLVKDENDNILINEQIFNFFFPKVSTLVLSPVIVNSRSIEPQVVKAVQILESWRATNPQLPILLFPNNPLTPLTATKVFFQKTTKDIEIYQQLLNIYPEEQNTLELCFRLAPSYLVSPTNFYNL